MCPESVVRRVSSRLFCPFFFSFPLEDEKARICVPHPPETTLRPLEQEGERGSFFSSFLSGSLVALLPMLSAIQTVESRNSSPSFASAKRDFNATQAAPLYPSSFIFSSSPWLLLPSFSSWFPPSDTPRVHTPTSRGLLIFGIRLRRRGQRDRGCGRARARASAYRRRKFIMRRPVNLLFACPPPLYLH